MSLWLLCTRHHKVDHGSVLVSISPLCSSISSFSSPSLTRSLPRRFREAANTFLQVHPPHPPPSLAQLHHQFLSLRPPVTRQHRQRLSLQPRVTRSHHLPHQALVLSLLPRDAFRRRIFKCHPMSPIHSATGGVPWTPSTRSWVSVTRLPHVRLSRLALSSAN